MEKLSHIEFAHMSVLLTVVVIMGNMDTTISMGE